MTHKRKLIIFSVFITIAVSVFCAFMIKSTKAQTLTVTDRDGVTYVAIIDQNSEVYAGVTDSSGSMYAAKIENGVVLKEQPLYVVGDYDGTFPYNDTTRSDDISINLNNDENIDFTGEAQTKENTKGETEEFTVPGENDKEEKTTAQSTDKKQPEEYMADKYTKLFNSGIFAMTFTTDDPDLTEDITLAMKNGSVYMDTSMEGIACKVVYDGDKKSGYVIIPQIRAYCELPEDLAKDMSKSEFNMPDISEATSAKTYEVTIDGKDCVCEEFKFSGGEERSYYFYNGNLVRLVLIGEGGDTMLYNIKKLTSEVDNSYFEKPKGYLKVDLSWLETQSE